MIIDNYKSQLLQRIMIATLVGLWCEFLWRTLSLMVRVGGLFIGPMIQLAVRNLPVSCRSMDIHKLITMREWGDRRYNNPLHKLTGLWQVGARRLYGTFVGLGYHLCSVNDLAMKYRDFLANLWVLLHIRFIWLGFDEADSLVNCLCCSWRSRFSSTAPYVRRIVLRERIQSWFDPWPQCSRHGLPNCTGAQKAVRFTISVFAGKAFMQRYI